VRAGPSSPRGAARAAPSSRPERRTRLPSTPLSPPSRAVRRRPRAHECGAPSGRPSWTARHRRSARALAPGRVSRGRAGRGSAARRRRRRQGGGSRREPQPGAPAAPSPAGRATRGPATGIGPRRAGPARSAATGHRAVTRGAVVNGARCPSRPCADPHSARPVTERSAGSMSARAWGVIVSRSPVAWLMIGLLSAYRFGVSPLLGARCRFEPSCSAYALAAVRGHGAARGIVLSVRRLLRCQPWGGAGYDPVPPGRHRHAPPRSRRTGTPGTHRSADRPFETLGASTRVDHR